MGGRKLTSMSRGIANLCGLVAPRLAQFAQMLPCSVCIQSFSIILLNPKGFPTQLRLSSYHECCPAVSGINQLYAELAIMAAVAEWMPLMIAGKGRVRSLDRFWAFNACRCLCHCCRSNCSCNISWRPLIPCLNFHNRSQLMKMSV